MSDDQLKRQNEEYERIIASYKRGDHLNSNFVRQQKFDTERESKLYQDAARIISEADVMKDYDILHIGAVKLPPDSDSHVAALRSREEYIKSTHDRIAVFEKLRYLKDEVSRARNEISTKEDCIGAILADIEKYRMIKDFDWQVEMHDKVRSIKAQIIVDKEDFNHATERLKNVFSEVQVTYPELISNFVTEMQGDLEEITTDESKNIHKETAMNSDETEQQHVINEGNVFGDGDSEDVFGWILGRVSKEGQIEVVLYGQFSRDMTVPSNGWIYMGHTIDNNLYIALPNDQKKDEGNKKTIYI